MIFIDTSAFYAMVDQNDPNHGSAVRLWESILRSDAAIHTTMYVIAETCALLQARLGIAALREFHQRVFSGLTIEPFEMTHHLSGVEAVLAAGRRNLSLVDCVSFQSMRRNRVRSVFCFDEHFREQGFDVLS